MDEFNRKPDEPGQATTAGQVMLRSVELTGLYAMLVLAVYVFTGQFGFSGWAVHPYWLPVLLFAAHYGLLWGILSAMAAVCLHILATQATRGFSNLPLSGFEASGQQAAAWLLAAGLVGAYCDAARRRALAAELALSRSETACAKLEAYARTLEREDREMRTLLARGKVSDLTVSGTRD